MSRAFGKKQREGGLQPRHQKDNSPRRDHPSKPDSAAKPFESGAGNAALSHLFSDASAGEELPSQLRGQMERAFHVDLGGVRIHDDSAAWQAAQSLDAEAFARGDEIVLGPDAPSFDSPEAEPLLAHEIAHVAQQRNTEAIEDRVCAPGEASERHAEVAGHAALAGAQVAAPPTGAVAGVQRQRKAAGASREQVEQALLAFLNRVLTLKPAPDLRHSRVVRNALDTLVLGGGPNAALVNVEGFLASVPNEPREFARRFARLLPASIDPAALERLQHLATADSPSGSAGSRVIDLFSSTQAGGSEPPTDPQRVSPADQADQMAAVMRRWKGVDEPTTVGPVAVDVLQLGRFFHGLPRAVHPPEPRAPAPSAKNYPEVEGAIARIPIDALIPSEARGKPESGEFADAREFARELARQIDVAQQRGIDTVTLNLGDNYAQVKDHRAIVAAVEAIIAQIRAALPHHGSNVVNVDIMAGKTWLTRGRPRATP